MTLTVVVVGAGIGGLTAAIALRRAGATVSVYDRAPSVESIQVGIGMVLWPNGMRALDRLGLAEAAQAAGAPIETIEFYAAGGRLLNAWSVGEVGRRVGQPSLAVSRGEFHAVLADAYATEGEIVFGARFADFDEADDGITVSFDDGLVARADVLIGADGVVSPIRRKLTGTGPPEFPPYAGYTIWHEIVDYDGDEVPAGVFTLLFGRGSRFAHYRLDAERVYWSGIGFVPAGAQEEIHKAAVLERFGDYRDPVPALIQATDESAIQRHDIFGGQSLGEPWGSGRATLLGDAAHPMTTNLGQGAGMAIEDGVVLAQCLERAATPVEGLRAYEQRRITRTDTMMNLANRLNSSAALEGRFRTAARNVMISRAFNRGLKPRYEAFMEAEALA